MKALMLVLSMMLLQGCAFTVHDVQVNYEFEEPISLDLASQRVTVGEFSDGRGAANPRLLMNMRNLYGDTTSGGWQAEKPLAEIVRDAVEQGLESVNANVVEESGLRLTGQLEDFSTEIIMGFWEGTLNGRLTVKMQLTDAEVGRVVWQNTYIGGASVKGGEGAVGLFRASLSDLVKDMLEDPSLIQHLQK